MKAIRAFIAFDLPDDVLEIIGEIQKQLKKKGLKLRWVPVCNIHLTVKFIGDLPADLIDQVAGIMTESAERCSLMTINASGMGVFPGLRRPSVLWIGIHGETDRLIRFQKTLDENLERIGIQSEKRPFRGHLTIGRVKTNPNMELLKESLRLFNDFQTRPFTIKEVKLFQSELTPAGAVYSCIKSIALSGPTEK
ncbi:MAG: RNA 2',3'-cyclic phosphodiesterase [Desulfobacteraceae bacterium]|nr:MAG: RNA 2',3'-cyclic phosphodiesterase [Desulfobacteraceae bacterium]